jgi:hypothetical protein
MNRMKMAMLITNSRTPKVPVRALIKVRFLLYISRYLYFNESLTVLKIVLDITMVSIAINITRIKNF